MSTTGGSLRAPAVAPTGDGVRTAPIRGIVGAPLWAHALLLCLVLAAFVGITRPGYGFSSDEGAAAAQAHLLDHGSWTYDYPLSWMDGADGARPFVRGDVGSEGVAPYAKHPLYPVSLWLVGSGTVGAYGLSVVGTCLLYTSPSPRDGLLSRMPSSA